MKRIALLAMSLWLMAGCTPHRRPEKSAPGVGSGPENWNITVLLDLSDRICTNRERDIELVRAISTCFRAHFAGKNLFTIRDRLRIFFYPEPPDQRINTIAENLKVQLNPADKAQVRKVWETIEQDFYEQLNMLYDMAEAEGRASHYPGSDIWRFFKERAAEYCIEPFDTTYRNILVIITDGYVFHKDSRIRAGNRTSFLTGPLLDGEGLRNNAQWREKFDAGDYGFIANPSELGGKLEVLVLEINASPAHRNDDEIVEAYWSKWLEEMGVVRYRIYPSDLPSNTEELIKRFLAGSV